MQSLKLWTEMKSSQQETQHQNPFKLSSKMFQLAHRIVRLSAKYLHVTNVATCYAKLFPSKNRLTLKERPITNMSFLICAKMWLPRSPMTHTFSLDIVASEYLNMCPYFNASNVALTVTKPLIANQKIQFAAVVQDHTQLTNVQRTTTEMLWLKPTALTATLQTTKVIQIITPNTVQSKADVQYDKNSCFRFKFSNEQSQNHNLSSKPPVQRCSNSSSSKHYFQL